MAKPKELPNRKASLPTPVNDDHPPESQFLAVARATLRRKPPGGGQPLARQLGEDLAETLAAELADRLRAVMPAALTDSISADLLEGADEIALFLFGDRGEKRKIYHLVQAGGLPFFRFGTVLCARKSTLLAWIKEREENPNGVN